MRRRRETGEVYVGRWPVVVTNEAETASRITQMMAVPKGNGHDRWQEVVEKGKGGGGDGTKLGGTMAF